MSKTQGKGVNRVNSGYFTLGLYLMEATLFMKITVFWDVARYSLLKVFRSFVTSQRRDQYLLPKNFCDVHILLRPKLVA
jgi:hypothetical protein